MENKEKGKEKSKTGLIPNEQLKGSDADKAYDENQNAQALENSEPDKANKQVSPGADADKQA
ncbi:hypothetical protein [Pedobacter aquatilis]|uniref:hypothetical protein n=1 Tax=Pedobacter aquatilis TaxID=351343 RepID=UPI00292E8C46|nr:hypothetical protein [Pedobacter aquatilis]